ESGRERSGRRVPAIETSPKGASATGCDRDGNRHIGRLSHGRGPPPTGGHANPHSGGWVSTSWGREAPKERGPQTSFHAVRPGGSDRGVALEPSASYGPRLCARFARLRPAAFLWLEAPD